MKAPSDLMRHSCKETEQAPAIKKASAANRNLMFHIYPNFCIDDFSANRTQIVLILLGKKRLQSWYEEEAHESFRIVAAQKKHLLFFKQEKWKRELY